MMPVAGVPPALCPSTGSGPFAALAAGHEQAKCVEWDYTGVITPGRIRTDTAPGLSRSPLLLGYGSEKQIPAAGLAPALSPV